MKECKTRIKIGEVLFERIIEGFLKVKPPKKKRQGRAKKAILEKVKK